MGLDLADLLRLGLVEEGDRIVYNARVGKARATITADGKVLYGSGTFTLSGAACEAGRVGSADGWLKWRLERTGETMAEVRHRAGS